MRKVESHCVRRNIRENKATNKESKGKDKMMTDFFIVLHLHSN